VALLVEVKSLAAPVLVRHDVTNGKLLNKSVGRNHRKIGLQHVRKERLPQNVENA